MNALRLSPLFALAAAFAGTSLARAEEKVTYNDHILPLFKNACLNCHNPDKKKAGLDLSTYQAALAGSDNGKIMESGNPAASLLIKCCKQTEDPKMPPKGDKLSDPEIALLEKWVAGQLLETANGKAVVASNKVDVAVISLTRPDGPAPMPATDLPLEPLVHTKTTNALVALAASPWAPLVAVGGQKQIILYNTATLQPLGILPFPEGFPAIIRFSRNGKLLLTGGGLGGKSGKVVLWDVQTGERAGEVGNEFDQVLGADISPDQAHVALGGPGKVLKIYATKDGKLEQSIKKHTDWITAVAFSPDGKYLASADRNGGIAVWEGVSGREFNTLPGHKVAVTALAFMPGVLASASDDGKISLWDVKEGKEIRSWAAHGGGASSVDFTPDGRLVSAGRDKLAKAWDQTGKALLTSEPFQDIALRAVMTDERLVAGDWTGRIRVFNLKDGGKAAGELTSNPLTIADNLAAARKELDNAQAAKTSTEQALAAAEQNLRSLFEAAQQKHHEAVGAAEAALQQAKAELETLKSAPAPIEAQLKAARLLVEETAKATALLPEAERGGEQPRADAQRKIVAELEAKLAAAVSHGQKAPAAEKKVEEAAAALAAVQTAPVKLPPAPERLARIDALTKAIEAKKAEIDKMREARAPFATNLPEYASATTAIVAKKAELDALPAQLDAARKALATHPLEEEVPRLKAALAGAQPRIDAALASLQRWQRAQAFMTVHHARETLAELQGKYDGAVATAKDALSPVAQAEREVAAAETAVAAAPALLIEKETAFTAAQALARQADQASADAAAAQVDRESKKKEAAALEEKLSAELPALVKRQASAKAAAEKKEKALEGLEEGSPKFTAAQEKVAGLAKEEAESQAALDAANQALASAKQQAEALTAEAAKAREIANDRQLAAKKAANALAAADSALTSAKKAKAAAEKTVAELKPKLGEIAEAARQAQAKAEQDAATFAQQLEAAKAEAARVRAEYEAKYPPAAVTKPIAAG